MSTTRVWTGKKEFSTDPYFVGQVMIESGRKRGGYMTVTREYKNREAAEVGLIAWLADRNLPEDTE